MRTIVRNPRRQVEEISYLPVRQEIILDEIQSGGRSFGRITKRALDIVGASIVLFFCAPLIAIVSAMIFLESGGPVIFRQTRLGLNGRPFTVYKFRSMYQNSESLLEQVARFNEHKDGPIFKWRNDPRITRVGRYLRRASLDELLQLWNVLRGEMSLVGPRPPLASEVLKYEEWQLRRLTVKPGMTGIWQVSGRSTLSFQEMVSLDLKYIDEWSVWMDLALLAKTPLAVLSGRGAY